jgi:hypothetical protein
VARWIGRCKQEFEILKKCVRLRVVRRRISVGGLTEMAGT